MSKRIYPQISEQIPDFIRSNYELFEKFLKVYFEYMEKQNDSDSSTDSTLYKKLTNPNDLIQGQQEYRDPDKTLEPFLEYFKRDILPISVTPQGADDRFIINKIRDLYLSKGTPDSFKSFFRLLYGKEIEVLQPSEQILDASEGTYVSNDVLTFISNDSDGVLNTVDFNNSFIEQDDSEIANVVFGSKINKIGLNSVVTITTSAPFNKQPDSEIIIINRNDRNKYVTGRVLRQIKNLTIEDSEIGLYNVGDEITVKQNNNKFVVPVRTTTSGPVTSVIIKNRGIDYSVNDTIIFTSKGYGTGGSATITEVDSAGRILSIDNNNVRTGVLRNGYLSNDFQNVNVPILQGGSYSQLPQVKIISGAGHGAEIVPFSNSIGRINDFNFFNKGFFDSEGHVIVTMPMNFNIHGETDLNEGQTVRIQKFEADSDGFLFDSDTFRFSIKFSNRNFDLTDSELVKVRIPYSFNFNTFQWIDSEFTFRHTDSDSLAHTLKDILDREIKQKSTYKFKVIDSDEKGNPDSETLRIFLQDPNLKGLDNFHFDILSRYEDSDKYRSIAFKKIKQTPFLGLNENVGRFKNTKFLGKVASISKDKNIVKIKETNIIDSDDIFPFDSDLNNIEKDRYKILRLVPVDKETNNVTIDEQFKIKNVIANHQRGKASVVFEGSGQTSKQFLDEKGFLNSLSGGVLRDNFFFDIYSYVIKSNLSISDWREYVKNTLHPAGMNMLSSLNVNSDVNSVTKKSAKLENISESFKITFDRSLDHSLNAAENVGAINAATSIYSTNAFNYYNATFENGTSITADNTSLNLEEGEEAEFGNSFWDYEPIGFIDPKSTQVLDSDNSEFISERNYIHSTYDIKSKDSDYSNEFYKYKNLNRYPDQYNIVIGKTQFKAGTNIFMTFNSEKQNKINFIRFDYTKDSDNSYVNDSEESSIFKGIVYKKLKDTDSDFVKQQLTKRNYEYLIEHQNDLNNASKMDDSFSYAVNGTTFFNLEAFEQKWNTIHRKRKNNQGWEIQGFSSAYVNATGVDYRYINNHYNLEPIYSKIKSSVNKEFWNTTDTIVWKNAYISPINNYDTLTNLSYIDSDSRNPNLYNNLRRD